MGDPGPPLCLAGEISIFVGVSDYDAGVVIRFALAQRGTRVLDLGQRRGSRSPCGRKNIQPTSGNRISRKKAFCELRRDGVLGSTYSPGPTLISVPGWDRHSSGIIPTLGTLSTRFSEPGGAPPGADRRWAARVTAGMSSCVAKRVSRPIRNREVRLRSRE
jgi:hypothetical protein